MSTVESGNAVLTIIRLLILLKSVSNEINKEICVTLSKQSLVSIILKTTYLFSLASINGSFALCWLL